MLFSELKRKEVINMKDCNKLGHVTDLEFDHCNGCIHKITVTPKCSLFSKLFGDQEYVVCFHDIKQIGPDIIMVDLH